MKVILFDLGDTLEDAGAPRDGALDALEAISAPGLVSGDRPALMLALASDFEMPAQPADVPAIRQRYFAILDDLGIRRFFEPVDERVTLSTEVGVGKPDVAVFQAVVAKARHAVTFDDVLFVTENQDHVLAARTLGLHALHLRGPRQAEGEVDSLADLVPLVREFAG